MIKIAICDDDVQELKKMSTVIKYYLRKAKRKASIVEFDSGSKLLNANIYFDIIFLEIEMPQMDGIETAQKLRNWDVNAKIIYVANYNKYQNKAYKVHAFDYITKPIQAKKVHDVLNEAISYLDRANKKHKYAFKTEMGIITLGLDDIYYFEYFTKKVIINSNKGKYVSRYRLKEIYEKIGNFNFEFSHKSFIVNFLQIKCIKGFEIIMENGDIVPLAQKGLHNLKKNITIFLK